MLLKESRLERVHTVECTFIKWSIYDDRMHITGCGWVWVGGGNDYR